MALRPIDMQVLVGKLYDVGRAQYHQDQAPLVSQQSFAAEFRERTEREQTQVQATHRGESEKVSDERKGSGGGYTPSRRRPRQERKTLVSGVKDPVRGRILDITL